MKGRCLIKSHTSFPFYGALGISVCERWLKFENFYEDMHESYLTHVAEYGEKKTTLDRKLGKNYSKSNCSWKTMKEQCRNTKRNRLLTYEGKNQCVSAWAEEMGLGVYTLFRRLDRGWSIEKALTQPLM